MRDPLVMRVNRRQTVDLPMKTKNLSMKTFKQSQNQMLPRNTTLLMRVVEAVEAKMVVMLTMLTRMKMRMSIWTKRNSHQRRSQKILSDYMTE